VTPRTTSSLLLAAACRCSLRPAAVCLACRRWQAVRDQIEARRRAANAPQPPLKWPTPTRRVG
jgi:hypothetical protein